MNQDLNPAGAPVYDDEDEISLLDLLLVVAENFWLLVLGSCSAAVLGFVAAGFFQPAVKTQALYRVKFKYLTEC